MWLANLLTDDAFIPLSGVPDNLCEGPGKKRTVFDDFETAFVIVEYLASPEMANDHLSTIFTTLGLVVVVRFLEHHSCRKIEP